MGRIKNPFIEDDASGKDKPFIPQRPEELTAAWFTTVLPHPGTVSSLRVEDIGQDVGFIGEVYRCHLEWEPGTEDPLASVVVKVPTQNDENFALGDALQAYEREVTVYQHLQAKLGLPMPGYYYAAMDPDPAPWLERPLLFLFEKLPIGGINWLLAQFLKLAGNSKRRYICLLYTSPSPRDATLSRMPSSA